jgi:hydroxysqualene synthase
MQRHSASSPIGHYENFPVASWLCPPQLRPAIAAIYHFARTADDLADEGEDSPEQRLHALQDYRAQLQQAAQSEQSKAQSTWDARWQWVFEPLQETIAVHRLPLPELHALLDAFVQDVEKTRDASGYITQQALLDYCRRSANPVGRLLLHLYGINDAQSLAQSDAICSALQLANFWQDPSVDLPRGRNYFPDDLIARHGVRHDDLWALRQTPAITNLLQDCVAQARALMLQGAPLVHRLPGRAGWELRLVVQGGLRILDRIEALGYATLQQRPTLRAYDYVLMAWRALCMVRKTAPTAAAAMGE